MPFKNKSLRTQLEARLDDLAGQTEDLRKQVVDRAPEVRAQLLDLLPDKDQLIDIRDDLFDRLPDGVQDKLPESVKPQRNRLRKVAAVGVLTGAGAAAFAILRRRGATPDSAFPADPTPRPTPTSTPTAPAPTDVVPPVEDPTNGSSAKKA